MIDPQTPTRSHEPPVRVLDARVVRGSGGGPDKTILRSPRHLDPRRVEMTAAYLHPEGDAGVEVLRAAAERFRCPIRFVPDRGPFDLRVARELVDICRELHINVWHGHDYKTNLLGLWLRRRHPMTLVTTAHGWTYDTWRMRAYIALEKRALRHYDRVIAVSEPLRDECVAYGVDPARVTVVPNGIDCDDYRRRQTRDAARAALGMLPDEVAIGFVGRLSPEKRVAGAVLMFARLAKRNRRLRLHLAGAGPQREALEELCRDHGVERRVHFHGWASDPRTFYEAIDLLLLPSLREGAPNAVLEAMAIGVPVAATDVGSVRQLLDDGRCGLILDPLSPDAWDAPVAELLADPVRRAACAEAARERVERHFNFAARTRRVQSIYEEVLGVSTATPALRLAA